jgi:tetratricopeptide (TPR) repeat protein
MMAADGPSGASAVAASGGIPVEAVSGAAVDRARQAWSAVVVVLRALTAREDLSGQAMIAEARRQQHLALSDAHALAALHDWVDRLANTHASSADAIVERERAIARDALQALDNAMESIEANGGPAAAGPRVDAAPGAAAYIDSVSAMGSSRREPPVAAAPAAGYDETIEAPARRRWGGNSRVLLGVMALSLLVGIGVVGWMALARRNTEAMYRDAVAAYQRGARETARVAFARVAQDRPDDPRPLVFLGRIAREDRDFALSRRFLEAAVRTDPRHALAQREFASTMLAEGQPELARRFYVRAIELDPADRAAQGFLGCALLRLNRFDEARRWFDRAGPGDWMQCAAGMPPLYPGPYPVPYPGAPPPQYPPPYPPAGR